MIGELVDLAHIRRAVATFAAGGARGPACWAVTTNSMRPAAVIDSRRSIARAIGIPEVRGTARRPDVGVQRGRLSLGGERSAPAGASKRPRGLRGDGGQANRHHRRRGRQGCEGAQLRRCNRSTTRSSLRYTAWVAVNRKKVSEKATGGRIAYIHIPNTAHRRHPEFTKQIYPQVGHGRNRRRRAFQRWRLHPRFLRRATRAQADLGVLVDPRSAGIPDANGSDGRPEVHPRQSVLRARAATHSRSTSG